MKFKKLFYTKFRILSLFRKSNRNYESAAVASPRFLVCTLFGHGHLHTPGPKKTHNWVPAEKKEDNTEPWNLGDFK
jgi:hypothetical protein